MHPIITVVLALCCLLLTGVQVHAKPSCGKGGPNGTGSGNAGAGTFRYSVPSSYSPAKATPLLLALHGDEGKPDYIYSVFKGMQSTSGGAFILVAPRAPHGGGSWYQSTTNHETFINAVITKLLGQYNIDQDRIWVTGWSGGATFLSYYAIKRQDIVAAVVFHMGGGGGGSYSPPPSSCKIPCRWVVGTSDFLYSMAKKKYNQLTQSGHETKWVDLPGVGHKFQQSTLPATWSWLQARTLCNKTTPGSCGPKPPPPPPPPPPPKKDSGPPKLHPTYDTGPGPTPDAGPGGGADGMQIRREAGVTIPATPPGVEGTSLLGGCAVGGTCVSWIPSLILALMLVLLYRRRRRG